MKTDNDQCVLCHRALRASRKVYQTGGQAHYSCSKALTLSLNDETLNKAFEAIVRRDGAYVVEERMHKLDSYRKFNRKYPYDAKKKLVDLEKVADFLPDLGPSQEEQMIMSQAAGEYLAKLTPKQRRVVELRDEGYKPQEMAHMEGREESGRERWHLHTAKQKLIDYLKGDNDVVS